MELWSIPDAERPFLAASIWAHAHRKGDATSVIREWHHDLFGRDEDFESPWLGDTTAEMRVVEEIALRILKDPRAVTPDGHVILDGETVPWVDHKCYSWLHGYDRKGRYVDPEERVSPLDC